MTEPYTELAVPPRIARLKDLAYNLWWSWNLEARALFKDIEYPYPYAAHTVRIGQKRTIYVTFIDDLSAYYGENDLMKLIEAKNQGERWEEIMAQFNNTVARFEHYNIAYRSDMSYWPTPPQQQAAN